MLPAAPGRLLGVVLPLLTGLVAVSPAPSAGAAPAPAVTLRASSATPVAGATVQLTGTGSGLGATAVVPQVATDRGWVSGARVPLRAGAFRIPALRPSPTRVRYRVVLLAGTRPLRYSGTVLITWRARPEPTTVPSAGSPTPAAGPAAPAATASPTADAPADSPSPSPDPPSPTASASPETPSPAGSTSPAAPSPSASPAPAAPLAVSSAATSFHFAYVLPSDAVASDDVTRGIPHEAALVSDWFAAQSGGRRPTLHGTDGRLTVTRLRLDRTRAELEADQTVDSLDRVLQAVNGSGAFQDDAIVVVITPLADHRGCGSAGPGYVYIPTEVCNIRPSDTTPRFPYGGTFLLAHEMTHKLGAVRSCAPHHGNAGHVLDDPRDILYEGPRQRAWDDLALDPGHDDYFGTGSSTCPGIERSAYWG